MLYDFVSVFVCQYVCVSMLNLRIFIGIHFGVKSRELIKYERSNYGHSSNVNTHIHIVGCLYFDQMVFNVNPYVLQMGFDQNR